MQPNTPPPPDSDWNIPDYVVDSPYDQELARTRGLHFDRRTFLAIRLLILFSALLVLCSLLAYENIGRVRLPSVAIFAFKGLPDTSLPLTLLSATLSAPTPQIPSATPALPSSTALVPGSTAPPSPEPQEAATAIPIQGSGNGYLLHQVQSGESLAGLAEEYNTSIEVLTAANQPVQVYVTAQAALASADVQLQGATLPPGTLLVILPDQKDPAGVPLFEVVYIDAKTSVSAIADLKSISAAELREINDLGEADWIPAGRYLIIPRQ